MAGFLERVMSALGGRAEGAGPEVAGHAPAAVPVERVVADGDARAEAARDLEAEERLRRRAECSPNGVFALFAMASLDARVSGIPTPIAFNRVGYFKGALAASRLPNGRWRVEGDREHLHEALRWALPSRPADVAKFVLRATRADETDHRVAAFTDTMRTEATVATALGAVVGRLPRHALLAALSAPGRALEGLGVRGTAPEFVEALLATGVGVDEPLADGLPTALACAAARGDAQAVSALLAAGADPSAHTFGRGPAHDAAALAGSGETVRLLSGAGYRFDVVDEDGLNGLHFLLHGPWTGGMEPPPGIDGMHNFRDESTFLALVDAGANPRHRSDHDVSPIEFLKARARSSDRQDRRFGERVLDAVGRTGRKGDDGLFHGEEIDGDEFEISGELTIDEEDLDDADALADVLREFGARGGSDPARALRDLGWEGSLTDGKWTFDPVGGALTGGRWDADREDLLSALARNGFEGEVAVRSRDSGIEVAYRLADGALEGEPRDFDDGDDRGTGFGAAP